MSDGDASVKTVCLFDIFGCAVSCSRFALLSVGLRNMTGSSANWQSLETSGRLALASLAWGVPRLHFISSTSPIEMDLKANGTNALRTLEGFYVCTAEVFALLIRDL